MQAPSLKEAEAFMVESETMVKPHYVTVTKKRKGYVQRLPGLKCMQDLFLFFSRS